MTNMKDIITKDLIIKTSVKEEKAHVVSNETIDKQINVEVVVTKLDKTYLRFVLSNTYEYSNPDNKSDKINVYDMGSIIGVDELHEVITEGKSMSQYFYKTIDNGYVNADALAEMHKSSCFAKTTEQAELRANFIRKSKKIEVIPKGAMIVVCAKLADCSYVLYNGKEGYVDNNILEEFIYSSKNLASKNTAPLL